MLEDLGNIGEFASSIGVLITLIYLALQVRQHNQQVQRTESNATFDQLSSLRLALATDREFAELLNRGLEDPGSLDVIDQSRHSSAMSEVFYISLNMWSREQKKEIDAAPWSSGFGAYIGSLLNTSGGRVWWDANRVQFPVGYIEAVEKVAAP